VRATEARFFLKNRGTSVILKKEVANEPVLLAREVGAA
jgi:hypothetical protein